MRLLSEIKTWIRRLLDVFEPTAFEATQPMAPPAPPTPAAEVAPPPRKYDRREIVLPSGRFAAMAPIRVADIIASTNPNALANMVALSTCCVAIDGEPLTVEQAFHMEFSEFLPIINMLHAETVAINAFNRGVA